MLWSDTYEAWRHYKAGNPNVVLLDGAGATEIDRFSSFNQSGVQNALDDLS